MLTPVAIPVLPGLIDPVLRAFPGGKFVLGAGAYQSRGAWAFDHDRDRWMMAAGAAAIIGRGPRATSLRLADPERVVSGRSATYLHLLTAGGRDEAASGIEIRGLTLECPSGWPTKALQIWGSQVKVEDVVVDGLSGDRSVLEGEGFGILVNPSPDTAEYGGADITRCVVRVVPGAYACGIYVGIPTLEGLRSLPSTVSHCQVLCSSTPRSRAHCAFGLQGDQTLSHCEAHGFERAIFSDTGSGANACVTDFLASGCSIGLELRASDPAWYRRGVHVQHSQFIFGGGAGGYVAGVVLADDCPQDGPRPVMSGISVTGCTFVNASTDPGHVGSSTGAAFEPVVFRDCEFVGRWDDAQARAAGWRFERCRFTR